MTPSLLRRLLGELHGRSVWQVCGLYVASGWVVLEVTATLVEQLGLPGWVFPGALSLLVLGLPIVLATAFVQRGLRAARAGDTSAVRRLFTWRACGIAAGVGFALLGIGTAGHLAMRTLGIGPLGTLVAKGIIQEGELIVLADLEDRIGDPRLARGVTEALRINLEQTPSIRLLGPDPAREALGRMMLPDTTSMTEEIAREIVIRRGLRAFLTGSISTLGRAILITVRLKGPDGTSLLSAREEAEDESGVMAAVDRISNRLRERAGESLRSVRASPPLEDATTASLEALKLYGEGLRLYHNRQLKAATQLLRQATRVDSTFAMAWVTLAYALRDSFRDRTGQVEAIRRAFALRDRLPEVRRLYLEGMYYGPIFRDETDRSLEALRAAAVLDPGDSRILAYIAFVHRWRREDDSALAVFRRATALDTLFARPQAGIVRMLWNLDRFEEADSALAVMERRLPEAAWTAQLRRTRPLVTRDWQAADSIASRAPGDEWSYVAWSMDLFHGRLDRADRFNRLDPDAPDVSVIDALSGMKSRAYVALLGRRADPGPWIDSLDALMARLPSGFSSLDIPTDYLNTARVYAMLGAPERARAMLGAFDSATIDGFLGELAPDRNLTVAEIALAERRDDEAIRAFRSADVGSYLTFALPNLARAYRLIGRPDSAIAVAERLLDTTYWGTTWTLVYPVWYERLGELYDARGELGTAVHYYERFVDAWAEADPALQPRVAAARARLRQIEALEDGGAGR